MTRRQQQPRPRISAAPQAGLPNAGQAVRLHHPNTPNIPSTEPISARPTADTVTADQTAEALAKRRAFIQSLAKQAAQELACAMLASRDK